MNMLEKELQKLDKKQLQNKQIMLMGRIEHIRLIAEWLRNEDISIKAILDNDKKKQGLIIDNIPILAPEQALQSYQKDYYIIIYSPKYWEDMFNQVVQYGYQENAQIHILDKPNLNRNIHLIKLGVSIYQKLQNDYGKDVQIFLANCPLGDFYLLGLYFHQYCKYNQIDNYVIVGMSQGIEKLSSLFCLKAVKRLTEEESSALIRAWIFLRNEKIRLKPLTIWQGAFRFNPCQVRQKDGFSFLDTFTKMIYSLNKPIPYYPDMNGNQKSVEEVFVQNGLQRDKTVILSPFSYSLQPLPVGFWTKITATLKEKGYSIAVNVGEERECNFIKESVTLHMNFIEIMIAMEMAGTVIGMRSGFFDITAQAKCRRIVLYPPSIAENVVWNSTDIKFCGLRNMGLCKDANEWEVNDPEEIYKKIMEVL